MKNVIALGAVAILFILWFTLGESDENNALDVDVVTPVHSSAAVSSVPAITMNRAPSLVSESSESKESSHSSTQAQTKPYDGWDDRLPEDYKNWWRSRGRFSDFDLQEHRRLSLDELEALANKGDLKAIEVLRQNALEAKNITRYDELVDLSVVSGSLRGITLLSGDKLAAFTSAGRKNEADILEAYALQTFAFRRGDLDANFRTFTEAYNFYPNQEQELFIGQRADELMIEYEEKRKALGFAPFDNSPRAIEKERYDRAKEYRERQELEYRAREKDYRLQQQAEGKE